MGEVRKDALGVIFSRSVKFEFHGSTISRDGGLLAYRKPDEPSGGSTTNPAHRVLASLALSGRQLEQAELNGGQDAMASR